jgi:glycerol uptake facilitator-like aquaporin
MIEAGKIKRQLLAEFLGSLILVFTAISPIILAYNVLDSGVALAVLMDGIAVGLVLFVLIETLGPVSGAHLNPAVTVAMLMVGKIERKTAVSYIIVQIVGGILGIFAAHAMFIGHDFFQWVAVSDVARGGGAFFAEFVGTFMLVLVIFGTMHNKPAQPGLIIGLLVGGFLITTSSTMFANPQVTIARMFTWAIAGVRPADAAVFIVVQLAAAVAATKIAEFLFNVEVKN